MPFTGPQEPTGCGPRAALSANAHLVSRWSPKGSTCPRQFIIHTVGPVWHDGTRGEAQTLASCYRTALAVADTVGARSIAFPAISTGVYGYPPAQAAAVAVTTVRARRRRM